jgi:hypothetical protein
VVPNYSASGSKDNIGDSRVEKPSIPVDRVERFDSRRRVCDKVAAPQLFQTEVAIPYRRSASS